MSWPESALCTQSIGSHHEQQWCPSFTCCSCEHFVLGLQSFRPQASIWILFRNKNLNSSMFRPKNSVLNQTWNTGQNFSCWWSCSIYICIKLFLFITKTIKSQIMTKARAVGFSFLLEVELGHNVIHMKSDMKPPGCHDVFYITVNSMH